MKIKIVENDYMGKKNFGIFYREIKEQMNREFGSLTAKISYYSDKFEENKNYACAIIYAIEGKFKWKNGDKGRAKNQNGRSFYVIIQNTDSWPEEFKGRAGQGYVHDYLIRNVLGIEHSRAGENQKKIICCGGFSYFKGNLKFSSVWLNKTDQIGCSSDFSQNLSDKEKILAEYCFNEWKKNGVNHTFEIPSYISEKIEKNIEYENIIESRIL